MNAELKELEKHLTDRIDSLKRDTSQSIRAVHDRVDELYTELGQLPGQVIAAVVPQVRAANGNPRAPVKQWHESIPWKWVIGGSVFLGVLVLIKLGLDPENLREVVTILRAEAP